MPAAAKKSALVRALSTCVEDLQVRPTRRFLQGLATDELQYTGFVHSGKRRPLPLQPDAAGRSHHAIRA